MNLHPQALAFIDGLGGPELLLIFFIILVLFGGEKLPHLARSLGKSMREFKKAASSVEEEFKRALEEEPAKPSSTSTALPAQSPPPEQPAAPGGPARHPGQDRSQSL